MADLGVLGRIGAAATERVARAKLVHPVSSLRASPSYGRPPLSLAAALSAPGPNVIAEVKFASPSEGVLRLGAAPNEAARIAASYAHAGAAAVSVLTEPDFFGGDISFLAAARGSCPTTPLLMKDFMVDEYQLELARSAGADAVLLIAALLGPRLRDMHEIARSLGLSALIEVHDEAEFDEALKAGGSLIGVNSRNLKTLKVDLAVARRLAVRLPRGAIAVAESGLNSRADVDSLAALGYKGFLIGSALMRDAEPGAALKIFLT